MAVQSNPLQQPASWRPPALTISLPRAYYAAFYAAKAALLEDGLEYTKHSAVVAAVHQHYVKAGRLQVEQGKALSWLFELRSVADYGGTAHVSPDEAQQAIEAAAEFVEAIKRLLG